MNEIALSEFTPIPVSARPDNKTWILWHPQAGAFVLDTTQKNRKLGRMVTLDSNGHSPLWSSAIDSVITVQGRLKRHFKASLPKDAPEGGPELLKLALATLRAAYEPSPLKLRPGRSFDAFKKTVQALDLLATHQGTRYLFSTVQCHIDHGKAMNDLVKEEERFRDGKDHDALVASDISIWFGPYSLQGSEDAFQRDREGKPLYASIEFGPRASQPTSHNLIEAAETITDFYAKAAGDLGLDEQQLARRYAAIGLTPP